MRAHNVVNSKGNTEPHPLPPPSPAPTAEAPPRYKSVASVGRYGWMSGRSRCFTSRVVLNVVYHVITHVTCSFILRWWREEALPFIRKSSIMIKPQFFSSSLARVRLQDVYCNEGATYTDNVVISVTYMRRRLAYPPSGVLSWHGATVDTKKNDK